MRKPIFFKSILFALVIMVGSVSAWGQTTIFSENIGVPTGTTTIASYNGWQNNGLLTFSNGSQTNSADIRISSPSSGYTGASAGGNVYFTSTNNSYGFSIEGINASSYSNLTLSYAYRKEIATAFATLSIDYYNGTAWVTIANTSSTLFNESATAAVGWYTAKSLIIPSGGQTNSLKIRFVKSGSNAIRVDDIKLVGVISSLIAPTLTADATANTVDNNIDVTFTDDAIWRAAITAVKVGGTALSASDYSITAGNIQLKPSVGNSLLTTSGSKTISVVATDYADATVSQIIGAGAATKLGIKTQPKAPAINGSALATQPSVYIQDQYGNTTTSTTSVTAEVSAGIWTLGGTTTVTSLAGTTTFTGLIATSATAVVGASIAFSSAGLIGVTSGTFDIPTPPTAPLAPTITAITPGSASLSVAFTAGGNGGSAITTYKYSTDGGLTFRIRASGTTSSPISISTLSSDGTTPMVNGSTYQVQIKAVNAKGDGLATASTAGTPALQYCTPTTSTTTDGITNVTFNTINKTTTGLGGVQDYSAISTTVTQGTAYALSVSVNTGGNYSNSQKVWIDWNQDGSFNTTAGSAGGLGEEYILGTAKNVTSGISSLCPLSITIPSGASLGTTRMRVSSKYNAYTTSCATSIDGEFEDYSLIVISSSPVPTLTADATSNTVDNNIDITFIDDAIWRAAITAVKVGGTALSASDYSITAGNIQLKPSVGNSLLTTAGSKTITVTATGYGDATVTQVINAGVATANSTVSISPALASNSTTTVTLTAKDQYNNPVSGYAFKYDATITNNDATTAETYTINGSAKTTSVTGESIVAITNASGVATFTVALPATIDAQDGISIQVKLNDGTSNVGSAFSFTQLLPQTITFGSLSAVTYGDASFDLTATASSSLSVTYVSSNTAVATVNGSTVTIIGAGTANITASQAGNLTYDKAPNVLRALTVNSKTLTLPDAAATSKVYDGTNTAVITGTLTGIINSDNVTLTGTGSFADVNVSDGIAVTSTSTLGGTKVANYILIQPTGLTANITKANQSITFPALVAKTTTDADYSPGATSASSAVNPITYISSNTAVATIVSGNIHIVGAGTTNITASQAASSNYNAATDVSQSLTVTAIPVPNVIISQVYGGGGGTGATYTNDFVELYNTTDQDIDITDWSIQYYSATGTAASVFVFPASTTIKKYCHYLIQCAGGNVGSTLQAPDASTTLIAMSASSGKVVLYNKSTAQTLADATNLTSVTGNAAYVDYVPYGATSTPVFGSSTVNLTATTSAIRKYSGGFVYTLNIGNDFEVTTPFPRNSDFTTQVVLPVTNLSVSASDGVIRITAEAGKIIELYNAVGQKLLAKQTISGLNSIPVADKGLVIVKIGNQIAKVVL